MHAGCGPFIAKTLLDGFLLLFCGVLSSEGLGDACSCFSARGVTTIAGAAEASSGDR